MRTTIQIPDDLLAEAKKMAATSKRTLTAVVKDALREALNRRSQQRSRPKPVKLTTFGKSGLQEGIDLDDTSALLDLMEAPGVSGRR
ncbi:MAG: type II toxin-antitoxin system VapB family antitoxin [Thermodesulfobacteriota bacterium]|nr:type II toxin-antitoxin system VapB family antitoxin [Thermodesulfobacteriota bacterium]